MAEKVTIPGKQAPTNSPLIQRLTIVATALTALSVAVNLVLQLAQFMNKRPVQPDQRDRITAATLTLAVLRQLPLLIKQVRLLNSQLRGRI